MIIFLAEAQAESCLPFSLDHFSEEIQADVHHFHVGMPPSCILPRRWVGLAP